MKLWRLTFEMIWFDFPFLNSGANSSQVTAELNILSATSRTQSKNSPGLSRTISDIWSSSPPVRGRETWFRNCRSSCLSTSESDNRVLDWDTIRELSISRVNHAPINETSIKLCINFTYWQHLEISLTIRPIRLCWRKVRYIFAFRTKPGRVPH